jgi:uncharacterized repeat protein (TIGR03803 family)
MSSCTEGFPALPLVQSTSGKFYGTAQRITAQNANGGNVFAITPGEAFKTVYTFCLQPNCVDGTGAGENPVIQGTDGNLYGMTNGGANNAPGCSGVFGSGCGTVYKITPGGTQTTLHDFGGADGSNPYFNGLAQATNGLFYGLTFSGGPDNLGTVFSVDVGLGPFVETVSKIGKIGEHILILGSDLTGTTSVRFDDKEAKFEVVSPTEIVTTVPDEATTGFVTLRTPNGTLKSNVKFQVRED